MRLDDPYAVKVLQDGIAAFATKIAEAEAAGNTKMARALAVKKAACEQKLAKALSYRN